ncbi:fibronectin type III domain-containing protein [Arthrobacter sp.]|uniref:fibronectin type III domain-containing protein n=1 Tax=Arthrobacter sp. TaxID=1667 RepID=UPI0033939C52
MTFSIAAPAAVAAPEANDGGSFAYTEQAPPISIGDNLTISGTSTYGGSYIDFTVDNAGTTESLSLVTDTVPAVTNGIVSIVDEAVYLGNGTSADIIGSVDPENNGLNGSPLRVNFTSPFNNPSFETGDATGWTAMNQWVDLGVTEIAGFVPQDTSTYDTLTPWAATDFSTRQDNNRPASASWTTAPSGEANDGIYGFRLTSNMTTSQSCDVVHGPAIYSDTFEAAVNDEIYFDWRAYAGSDSYHVFGSIIDEVGNQTEVLDAWGSEMNTSWVTKATTIPADGSYRFVFVAGTFDQTCGRAAGASLVIDNVRVYGSKATSTVAQDIARKLQYQNTSDAPEPVRTVNLTATDSDGMKGTGAVTVNITAVDDAPTVDTLPGIAITNTESAEDFPTATGRVQGHDVDGDAIAYSIAGGTNSGLNTQSIAGTYGTLRLNTANGEYEYVPNDAAINSRLTNDSESFTLVAPASGVAVETELTVMIGIPATAPGAPRDPAVQAGPGQAELSWRPPTWIGGAVVIGYRIDQSLDGGVTWTTLTENTGSTRTTYEVDGLANGQEALFRILGVNANGTGPASNVVKATPISVPGIPRHLTAEPGNSQATLNWVAPTDNGGLAVTGYKVEKSTDGGKTWTTVTKDTGSINTAYTVKGLSNGQETAFRIAPLNAAGTGKTSISTSATPRTIPGAPKITSVTAGNRTLEITFDEPKSDGGSMITGYEYSLDGGATWLNAGEATGTLRVTGLINGKPQRLVIRALNDAGAGSSSIQTQAAAALEPVPSADGEVAAPVQPGTSALTVDGQDETIEVSENNGTWRVAGDGFTVELETRNDTGEKLAVDAEGRLVVTDGGEVQVRGTGFKAGTMVDVWLFSTPYLLGEVRVGDDGTFSESYDLPDGIEVGPHTVQLNGVSNDNQLRSLSTGLVVVASSTEPTLASTGANVAGIAWAAVFMTVGTLMLVALRRNKVSTSR